MAPAWAEVAAIRLKVAATSVAPRVGRGREDIVKLLIRRMKSWARVLGDRSAAPGGRARRPAPADREPWRWRAAHALQRVRQVRPQCKAWGW
ncbi:hypothetical protein CCO03_05405 [Comamonas serinivorans]|uniref:Uncharacterized protein n=1 Tax=Comamonas serinivorans TaxID=1082851 RepID=A0A1Y0ELF0_9BURK|nr:hypothetical protein CCO03_05405 [Comamonas serinivorans]